MFAYLSEKEKIVGKLTKKINAKKNTLNGCFLIQIQNLLKVDFRT